ncbi:MAG: hypothetical protein NT037_00055 [Hyphomicrobiales bacterium]|nr:hypothetical protein [Hyphomicrobiales bacterium]
MTAGLTAWRRLTMQPWSPSTVTWRAHRLAVEEEEEEEEEEETDVAGERRPVLLEGEELVRALGADRQGFRNQPFLFCAVQAMPGVVKQRVHLLIGVVAPGALEATFMGLIVAHRAKTARGCLPRAGYSAAARARFHPKRSK